MLIKYGGAKITIQVHELLQHSWQKKMPETWAEILIVPIHKKGKISVCNSYRGIALLASTYKTLATILGNPIKKAK